MVVVVDSVRGRVRCTKRFAQIVRKSAKFPSSPAETVRSTARIVFQSTRRAAVKEAGFLS